MVIREMDLDAAQTVNGRKGTVNDGTVNGQPLNGVEADRGTIFG